MITTAGKRLVFGLEMGARVFLRRYLGVNTLPRAWGKLNTDFPQVPFLPREFDDNMRRIPDEELDRFTGQYVAYSWDGRRIVACDPTREGLRQQLLDAGIDPQRVVFAYLDDL